MSKNFLTANVAWAKSLPVLISIFSCTAFSFAQAQVQQTERYEIVQKNSDEYFTVISLEEKGLALVREKDKYQGNKQLWEIIILDTNLSETARFDIEVNQRHHLLGYEISEDHLYLLYRTGETTKNSLELVEVSPTLLKCEIRKSSSGSIS